MKLNRNELRCIQYDFNSYSNYLLHADFNDYTDILKKYLVFLENVPIIIDYIKSCGKCDINLEEEVKQVQTSYGQIIFTTGDTEYEEVRNVYAILRYLVDNNNAIYYSVASGYSLSKSYQDRIKCFNERFVMVLIRHIERYLTKVGINMGLDERIVYNVEVNNGQAIIATDNAKVNATNQVGNDNNEISRLITDVRTAAESLQDSDKETVSECLEVIETEAATAKPKKSMLKTAISTLRSINGTVQFAAAVATISQFVETLV